MIYDYADGTVHNHFGQALPDTTDGALDCHVYGTTGERRDQLLGQGIARSVAPGNTAARSTNLYQEGIVRNIATFYENVTQERADNSNRKAGGG